MELQLQGGVMDDETLARMLQDELFSEELARNPDFAHLARGGRGGRSGGGSRRTTASNARIPGSSGGGAGAPNPFEGANVMQKISGKFCSFVVGLLLSRVSFLLFPFVLGVQIENLTNPLLLSFLL